MRAPSPRLRAVLFVAVALALGCAPALAARPLWVAAGGLALCLLAAAMAIEDLARMLIPDEYTLGVAMVSASLAWGEGGWPRLWVALLEAGLLAGALLLVSALYLKLRGRSGLGLGDVKLLAASTLLVGLGGVGLQIVLASVAAVIFVVLRAIRRRRRLRSVARIPFATFLAPALVLVWAWMPA